jgi:hypothetical protein
MGLADHLRKMRTKGPLSKTEADRQFTIFIEHYQGLRGKLLEWYSTSLEEGDMELAELKDVEIEDERFGIRKTTAFMLKIPVARRTIMFQPWGLTHRTPVWALMQIYPLNAMFSEHWVGLMVPPGQPLQNSDWVDLGTELIFNNLDSIDQKGFFQTNLDKIITGFLDKSEKPRKK